MNQRNRRRPQRYSTTTPIIALLLVVIAILLVLTVAVALSRGNQTPPIVDDGTAGSTVGIDTPPDSESEPPQSTVVTTDPQQTVSPPATNPPPESNPPATNPPPVTDPPITNPPETKPPIDNPGNGLSREEIEQLPNKGDGWGFGYQRDEDNRPIYADPEQKKFGKYDAHFIKGKDEKVVYLTFDCGYENGYTGRILDTLKEKNVKAVFFVTMYYVKSEPELVQRMIDEGHVIGNHSNSHPSAGMPSLSIDEQIADIQSLQDYVKKHFNYEMTLFRYPSGIYSEQSLALLQSMGFHTVFWSFAYGDYDPDNQMDPEEALGRVNGALHSGAIYLLHAISSTNDAILGDFIDHARSEGYGFSTSY